MLNRIVKIFGGDPQKRAIAEYSDLVDEINALEDGIEALSDEALQAKTDEFRRRLAHGGDLADILVEAFGIVREASKRTIGLRHYDVQLIGGAVLHEGKIAEMRTGEGKTLVATLPLYLNSLLLNPVWIKKARKKWGDDPDKWEFIPLDEIPVGRGAHLITVNDYLARRDARWKAPIYSLLGMSVGVLQMASRTESGRKAFVVDLEVTSPHEDQHQLRMVPRKEAYLADITYGTNSEFGFDYLRDNMAMRLEDRVQRGHHYAIIDEVDNVLIDEARTPLIISGPSHDDTEWYVRMAQVVKQLRSEDYEVNLKDRNVTLTEIGETHVEELLDTPLRDPERPEDITPEQARLLGYLEQALRAQHLFKRNKEYLLQAGKVVIVDEFTGRLMPGRRWSDGLHQAVEAKEGARVQSENVTYATITIQNYFRMYEKLSGMTGTALTEAEEFHKIYELDVVAIPTNLEYQAVRPESGLTAIEDRDEEGYKYTYYAHMDDPEKQQIFWKRKDFPDVVFRTEEAKLRAIVQEILYDFIIGRPLLVGTTSVELSEQLSSRLRAEPVRKLAQVLLIRYTWFEVNNRIEDGRQIPELAALNIPLDKIQTGEIRRMARELGLSLNLKDAANLERLLALMGLEKDDAERLAMALDGGVPHEVLNARKHTEESQIIAGAGAFGAVTIATNMAGRGVDIKLGGELAEATISTVNRVLARAGHVDPYDLTMDARLEALRALSPDEYGVFETEVQEFIQQMTDMTRVRERGGLHVIGSERHDARRIDNQLRGRSSRQGDPGSSRFYLSMEDELMRLFGGEQANEWMRRLNVDEALPLEHGMVSRIIEQAQTRVEGANFDARKHLLEYDDVLNTQRAAIYSQRDRIFTKDDLSEDVVEMLQTEILDRVPDALEDEEGPWRLLAWLDQVQPTLNFESGVYPNYTLRVLVENLNGREKPLDHQAALTMLLETAGESLRAEEEHVLHAVDRLLVQSQDRFEEFLADRIDAADIFFENLDLEDETETRSSNDLVAELSTLVRIPIRLSSQPQRDFREDPESMREEVQNQVEQALFSQTITRLLGAVQRRLEDEVALTPMDLEELSWDELAERILGAIQEAFARRQERLIGEQRDGLIAVDLEKAVAKLPERLTDTHLYSLLLLMPQGARAMFDRKTHRRIWQRTTRISYTYYAARFLENRDPDELAEAVLEHLNGAQMAIQGAWGISEFKRLADSRLSDLDETTQGGLDKALAEAGHDGQDAEVLGQHPPEIRSVVIGELGRQAITEVYRQLLLGVISELWVEYLTQMEALRVSIGLEAYAQRDPLVQYKSKAFEMFRKLLSDMRIGVVTRMFTFSPRNLRAVQTEVKRAEDPEAPPAGAPAEQKANGAEKTGKRRRRRRRKK
jgi:preprotein translocase subunit SecA